MSSIKKIAKNTSSLFIAQIITSILALILSIYLVRKLGDINYGKYSFALAFTTFFSIFLDFGYNTLFIRNVARDKSLVNTYLNNIYFIRALLSIIIFIFSFSFSCFLEKML
jgi:O-antigen/teichoic acid export membrane protein